MTSMLSFSFEELETALIDLAASRVQRDSVASFVSALRIQHGASGDRRTLLHQLLVAVWLIQNEDSAQVIDEARVMFRNH